MLCGHWGALGCTGGGGGNKHLYYMDTRVSFRGVVSYKGGRGNNMFRGYSITASLFIYFYPMTRRLSHDWLYGIVCIIIDRVPSVKSNTYLRHGFDLAGCVRPTPMALHRAWKWLGSLSQRNHEPFLVWLHGHPRVSQKDFLSSANDYPPPPQFDAHTTIVLVVAFVQ